MSNFKIDLTQESVRLFMQEDCVNLDVNKGKLVKKSFCQRFAYGLGINRSQSDKKMTQTFICLYNSEQFKEVLTSNEDNYIRKFSQLNKDCLEENELANILSKDQQNKLSPTIEKLRQEKTTSRASAKSPEDQLARRVAKAKLSMQLNFGGKANKGATGTLLIRSFDNKKILGVFKVDQRKASLSIRLSNFFKSVFYGELHYLSPKEMAQPQAEVAAYLTDVFFNFNLTPSSTITELNNVKGAFQVFLKDYMEAKDVVEKLEKRQEFSEDDSKLFQNMAIFDYLIGNVDRHEENWFLKLIKRAKSFKIIKKLKVIDNANSFIRKNPSFFTKFFLRHQYEWSRLKIAKQPFTANNKHFILSKLTDKKIEDLITHLDKKVPGFLQDDMKALIRQRARVLNKIAKTENSTSSQLAQYRTDADITAFLAQP